MNNDIIEKYQEEEDQFMKSLITVENISDNISEAPYLFACFLLFPAFFGILITAFNLPFYFLISVYFPLSLFLLFHKTMFKNKAIKHLKNTSEKQLLQEVISSHGGLFYNKEISDELHDTVKLSLSMDEYKRLCYSGSSVSHITYGQLKSFIQTYDDRKNDAKIIEDNKLSMCFKSHTFSEDNQIMSK